jgi:hypothetical protein
MGWGAKGVGNITKIDYYSRHDYYRRFLIEAHHTSQISHIFDIWNERIFPQSIAFRELTPANEEFSSPSAPVDRRAERKTTAELMAMLADSARPTPQSRNRSLSPLGPFEVPQYTPTPSPDSSRSNSPDVNYEDTCGQPRVGNCTGNPRVSRGLPVPIPVDPRVDVARVDGYGYG